MRRAETGEALELGCAGGGDWRRVGLGEAASAPGGRKKHSDAW